MSDHVRVCIVGAGFSGISAAINLRRAGVTDLVILERAGCVGGAWQANTYPGCACDVQSRLYELQVAPWPEWSRKFAGQREIRDYLDRVVEMFGLASSIQVNTELTSAIWDDPALVWNISTSAGTFTADYLISACGGLTEPLTPLVPGMADFTGAVMHTARWDHDVDLDGKRVAVVGTGASSIQVVPAIAPVVDQLVLLQRTPPWILPRRDRAVPHWYKRLLASVPLVQQCARSITMRSRDLQVLSFTKQGFWRATGERIARRHLRAQVPDEKLRRRVTPTYDMGCKRILLSDDYYPALGRDNVTLAAGLSRLNATGVTDADGVDYIVDVVIWATGFKVLDPPIASVVRGINGDTLTEVLAATEMAAYRGTAVSGFPNLFILQGPNTGLGHSSVVLMSEAQIDYIISAIVSGAIYDVDQQVQRDYVQRIDQSLSGSVWQTGGCHSWYQDDHGRNVALWPGSTRAFAEMMKTFDSTSYHVRARQDMSYVDS